ncbi:MAG: helical backbone metal receptor [Acidobacteriota bacterium]
MRIVSLCPSVTELVFDLGCGADLIGITRYCTHPPAEVEAIEAIGGTKSPKIERIVELRPDVVLLNEEENRREDAEALAEAGVHCHVSFPRTIADTAAMVRSIGAELERRPASEAIARDIEVRSERVRRAAAERAAVRWAYLIWRKPWMAANSDTFIDALLSLAGGENVFGAVPERYPEISAGELAAAEADVILLATEPFPFAPEHLDELATATGLPPERFRIVDGRLLSWHGSCTPAGIDYAEEVILTTPSRAALPG